MTTMKYMLISLTMILFIDSFANASLVNSDTGNWIPLKVSIFGHTGQDPAPHRALGWTGNNGWLNKPIAKESPIYKFDDIDYFVDISDKFWFKGDWVATTAAITTSTYYYEDHNKNPIGVTPPYNGAVPAPSVLVILAAGLLRRQRRA